MPQSSANPVIRRRKVPSRRRKDGLIQYARNETSQCGEDGILEALFSRIPQPATSRRRFCVDVGAWDGVHLSNTYSLLVGSNQQDAGAKPWKGVLIEADSERFQDLTSLQQPLDNTCLCVAVSGDSNDENSLVRLLQDKTDAPSDIDLLCIDVDGSDYWLMHDVLNSELYMPVVICVEFNPTMPQDLIYIPPQSDSKRHGASLAALVELAEQHDYVLVETTLYNAFFVLRNVHQDHLTTTVPETTIEALSEVTMGTSLYQLYDGTIKLSGCKKLLWHRVPIKEENIQILPSDQRTFPFAPSPTIPVPSVHDKDLFNDAIDMASYCRSLDISNGQQETAAMAECATQLWKQLYINGFCLVRGTGIDTNRCKLALEATRSFLLEAPEAVRRSCLAKDRARRGYSPMCTENFASLIGDKAPNDLVRKFRIGPSHDRCHVPSSPLLRPNIWPTGEVWADDDATMFRSAIESYYEASCRASHAVTRAICDGILQQHQSLKESMESLLASPERNGDSTLESQQSSILTLLGYSPGSRHKKKPPKPLVAPHTDVGIITFLLFDAGDCATLQRKKSGNDRSDNSSWVDVRLPPQVPEDPIFVVNIGDCLSELCNGLLPSTLHRVMAQPQGSIPRCCLALFVGLEPNQRLVFPQGKGSTNGEHELTFEEWRRHRIAAAQKMLND